MHMYYYVTGLTSCVVDPVTAAGLVRCAVYGDVGYVEPPIKCEEAAYPELYKSLAIPPLPSPPV